MLVRDRFWLWGHDAGSHDGIYGIPGMSRITPAEACYYLGIPNLLVVDYGGRGYPVPLDQYALPLQVLSQVVWSIVGASGVTDERNREGVLELAARRPNIIGVIMDDFFRARAEGRELEGALSLDQLRSITGRLRLPDRKLDLWVVLYDHQLGYPVGPYLDLCDKVTFWTWQSENLANLESNFAQFEQLAARQGKLLGCYMWDYGNSRPMPLSRMEQQCRFGLKLLRAGRIEGMIFLASCVCDLKIEAVEWARRWIAEVGGESL